MMMVQESWRSCVGLSGVLAHWAPRRGHGPAAEACSPRRVSHDPVEPPHYWGGPVLLRPDGRPRKTVPRTA